MRRPKATVVERRMLELERRIAASAVPPSRRGRSLTVATWNIRELGRRPRRADSLAYIAEIIRQFGVVAVVELREDLTELEAILRMLGPTWKALFTAPLLDPGGNRERATYVYDERVVVHTGLASQAQAPRTKRGSEYLAALGWWRLPFIASFRSGDRDILLLTAHIRWGANQVARLSELELLADWIATEMTHDPFASERELLVLGDFNIPSLESPLFRAITKRGLLIPPALFGAHGSNLARNKRYDQILQRPACEGSFSGVGGVVDFYSGGIRDLYPRTVGQREFTYELSDHLPLWLELSTERNKAARS